MGIIKYRINNKYFECKDTFIMQLEPVNGDRIFFEPGKYGFLYNPDYDPNIPHIFSIASSPLTNEYMEFCIKIYGNWTMKLAQKKIGDMLFVNSPYGRFYWDEEISYPVFLIGGVGIAPIMSILRTMAMTKPDTKSLLIYGNRTPDTVAYKKELDYLENKMDKLEVVHVFSNLSSMNSWNGYRGFITKEIIGNFVNFENNPTFFTTGPPIFIDKIINILRNDFGIDNGKIRFEKII